jgi:hypothetical protein
VTPGLKAGASSTQSDCFAQVHCGFAALCCLISDPKSKAKSVGLSKEGSAKAEALFQRLFCD